MGNIKPSELMTKNGKSVIIRTAVEDDAENYLNLGKSIIGERIYSLTDPSEFNLTVE